MGALAMQKHKTKTLLACLAIIAAGIAGYFYWQSNRAELANQTMHGRNDTPVEDSNVETSNPGSSSSPSSNSSVPLEKPVLIKSSGNNGPVPRGANIEFVCQAPAGLKCSVALTKATPAETITLEPKTVQQNQGSIAGASWYWTAKTGSWKIVANLSDGSRTSSSAVQNLEVQ